MSPRIRASILTLCLVAATFATTTTGCAVGVRTYDYPPPRPVVTTTYTYDDWPESRTGTEEVVVDSEPPPARYEVVTESPGVDFVWIGGYWGWYGGRWVWYGGGWRHCPPGYTWRSGVWVRGGTGYYYRRGGWVAPRGSVHFRHR